MLYRNEKNELIMDHDLITINDVTSTWLTSILKNKKKLISGNINTIKINPVSNLNGGVYQILLEYSDDAVGDEPVYFIDRQPFE